MNGLMEVGCVRGDETTFSTMHLTELLPPPAPLERSDR